MREITIKMPKKQSFLMQEILLIQEEVCGCSSEILLKTISENHVKQIVDFKGVLSATAILCNIADELVIEFRGEIEDYEASYIENFINKVIKNKENI